jgi:hypothetical protein
MAVWPSGGHETPPRSDAEGVRQNLDAPVQISDHRADLHEVSKQ